MTVRKHRDAVISWLQTDLANAVFKSFGAGEKAASVNRYAVVHAALSGRERSRYTGGQTRDTYTVTVHSVAGNEDSAFWVQERVDKLTGKTLTVSGRALWPVEYITGGPPDLDDDGPTPLWFSVSQFDIISDPA